MVYPRPKALLVLAAVLLTFTALASPAQAQLISTIDGTINPGSSVISIGVPPPGAVGNLVFEIALGSSTQFNGAPIPGGPVPTSIIASTEITAVSSAGGVTTYSLDSDFGFKQLFFAPAQGGGFVLFDIDFTQAVVADASPNIVTFRGTETIDIDLNPTFDFSPLNGGFVTMTLVGPAGTNFNTVLSTNLVQTVSVTGTFSQTFIPEPSTMVLLGLGLPLLGGFSWMRRRRRSH